MTRAVFLLAGSLLLACTPATPPEEVGVVVRVVDGDTLIVRTSDDLSRVRLLGVDAPAIASRRESADPYGARSADALAELVADEAIRIAFDPHQGRVDDFGRLLGYVFRARDDLFVNAEMIRLGQARVLDGYELSRRAELERLEQEAAEAGRGLWGL